MITTQKEIRVRFWKDNPSLSRIRLTDYSGNGKMYCTDTRCAFSEYVDMLYRDGQISSELAQRVTLET